MLDFVCVYACACVSMFVCVCLCVCVCQMTKHTDLRVQCVLPSVTEVVVGSGFCGQDHQGVAGVLAE